jgi:hypothetical protein
VRSTGGSRTPSRCRGGRCHLAVGRVGRHRCARLRAALYHEAHAALAVKGGACNSARHRARRGHPWRPGREVRSAVARGRGSSVRGGMTCNGRVVCPRRRRARARGCRVGGPPRPSSELVRTTRSRSASSRGNRGEPDRLAQGCLSFGRTASLPVVGSSFRDAGGEKSAAVIRPSPVAVRSGEGRDGTMEGEPAGGHPCRTCGAQSLTSGHA